MNENIKKLWEQAGGTFSRGNQHDWPHAKIDNPQLFAFLIMFECLDVCNQHARDDGTAQKIIAGIKELFGITPCTHDHSNDEHFDEQKTLNKLVDEMASVIDNQILESLKK